MGRKSNPKKGAQKVSSKVGGGGGGGFPPGGGGFTPGRCVYSGFSNVGLVSPTGIYSVTLSDGTSINVHEMALKQNRTKTDRFTCTLNGVKHKLKLDQIRPAGTGAGFNSNSVNINPGNPVKGGSGSVISAGGGGVRGGGGPVRGGGGGPGAGITGGPVMPMGAGGSPIRGGGSHVRATGGGSVWDGGSAAAAPDSDTSEYIHQVNVSSKPSSITFYPYYKIKVGDTVIVLPYHVICSGKASERFYRFTYGGKTITVKKSHITPGGC